MLFIIMIFTLSYLGYCRSQAFKYDNEVLVESYLRYFIIDISSNELPIGFFKNIYLEDKKESNELFFFQLFKNKLVISSSNPKNETSIYKEIDQIGEKLFLKNNTLTDLGELDEGFCFSLKYHGPRKHINLMELCSENAKTKEEWLEQISHLINYNKEGSKSFRFKSIRMSKEVQIINNIKLDHTIPGLSRLIKYSSLHENGRKASK
jgi:hypothetical protein